jgi:hypothetical protein
MRDEDRGGDAERGETNGGFPALIIGFTYSSSVGLAFVSGFRAEMMVPR